MRRVVGFKFVAGVLLLGGVAAAQQGLIIDPWGRHAPRPLTPLDVTGAQAKAPRALAEPAIVAPSAPAREVRAADSGPGSKWTPGLPVDIVDPWAPAAPVGAALAGRQSWARPLVDLVDPWAAERDPSVPAAVPARQSIY